MKKVTTFKRSSSKVQNEANLRVKEVEQAEIRLKGYANDFKKVMHKPYIFPFH